MGMTIRNTVAGLAALASVVANAPAAWAGCGDGAAIKPASWVTSGSQTQPPLTLVDDERNSIIGLWSVRLTSASGNNDDWGLSAWHSDGTEIMNSGGHTPSTGNFCLGVWAKTGGNHYHLNHFALSYVPSTTPPYGTYAAKINLKEDVSLGAGGNTFAGTFTIDIYVQGGPILHDSGTIKAQRITPD